MLWFFDDFRSAEMKFEQSAKISLRSFQHSGTLRRLKLTGY